MGYNWKKNHIILELKQEPFFKKYTERNTALWREAEKEGKKIEKQNARLRNNAIFGKSMENPMNKVGIKIKTTRKQYLKWSFIPTFKGEKQFCNGAIPIEKEKCRINLNKAIILEQAFSIYLKY